MDAPAPAPAPNPLKWAWRCEDVGTLSHSEGTRAARGRAEEQAGGGGSSFLVLLLLLLLLTYLFRVMFSHSKSMHECTLLVGGVLLGNPGLTWNWPRRGTRRTCINETQGRPTHTTYVQTHQDDGVETWPSSIFLPHDLVRLFSRSENLLACIIVLLWSISGFNSWCDIQFYVFCIYFMRFWLKVHKMKVYKYQKKFKHIVIWLFIF